MNFYDCLGVPETASYDEIRRAYYKKMLETHPDRSSEASISSSQNINAAWETLKDQATRLEYDTKIRVNRAAQENHAFYEPITLNDCKTVSENEWIFECRCGGECIITSTDIECGFRYFCCSNCSLKINLIGI